jgi:F-type H+-transporting ATPase subunit delta
VEDLAQVYARSLFEVARDQGKIDDVREQLGEVADAIEGDRNVATFFFSPYFSTEEKKDGLHKAVEGADEIVMNFLELLLEKHRMPVIYRIRREYDALWREENKMLPVQLTSAVELDEELVRSLGDRISERTGRRVDLQATVNPDIVGGIVLRVGNSILDASIRNRLEQLRKQVARG